MVFRASPKVSLDASPAQLRLHRTESDEELLIDWQSIRRLVAFKRDLFTHDLLCLALELDTDEVIELDESMVGWASMIDTLPKRLPGALAADEWILRTTFPAFAESPVEVFRRDSSIA